MIYNTNPAVSDSPLILWDNAIARGTISATSSATGTTPLSLLSGVTTDPWGPSAMPVTVTMALASGEPVSAIGFAGHNMAAKGVTVILERLVSAAWVAVMTVVPASDDPFVMSFPTIETTQWRVRFTGSETFSLAVMTLGNALVVPGRVVPPHVPLHRSSEVMLVGESESGTGEFLQADFERTGGRASINFSVQLHEFAAGDDFDGFRQHFNRGRPFFFASFPETYPLDMGYLWRGQRAQSITAPWRDAVFMTIGMECSVYVR